MAIANFSDEQMRVALKELEQVTFRKVWVSRQGDKDFLGGFFEKRSQAVTRRDGCKLGPFSHFGAAVGGHRGLIVVSRQL